MWFFTPLLLGGAQSLSSNALTATLAVTLDDINVVMIATNTPTPPPTPGLLQTLIEIRSFTERRF
jgi:hypothetical protein